METPQTEKKTCRTGRRIGTKDRCRISIAINDPDRILSRLWEYAKKRYSQKKITAAELGKKVFMNGIMNILEELDQNQLQSNEQQIEQDLFGE